MTRRLTVTEAVRNFSDILGRVRFKGERFILVKGGKPVAELRPTDAAAEVRLEELPAILEGLPHLDPEDADRFARDLESGRSTTGPIPAPPWGS
ncbi:MAG: antitoxin [Armatimonadota bacterium]|nr:antitoxin [Armatimonadota bacterium]MDR7547600.1 antitoxin [Armatimonadota bacterium]